MAKILLFGAGKSATSLIRYLITVATPREWRVVVAENNLQLALSKIGSASCAQAVQVDVGNEAERDLLVAEADIVISLLPPSLHYLVARSCLRNRRHLLTASYVDDAIRDLAQEVLDSRLLFLCEMGVDPGIDHMSALHFIGKVRANADRIVDFKSHTGGLVAPESDDNPWHYKISWNPRNVVRAGAAGARFRQGGRVVTRDYAALFEHLGFIDVAETGRLAWYANRDSLPYIQLYGLEEAETFVRTTLRYPAYCRAWAPIVQAGLTDDVSPLGGTGGGTGERTGGGTGERTGGGTGERTGGGTGERTGGGTGERTGGGTGSAGPGLAGRTIAEWAAPLRPYINAYNREMYAYLGLFDAAPLPAGARTAADVLQYLLETRLAMQPEDKDLIVMQHEIGYMRGGQHLRRTSTLLVKGEDALHTAMARTVGLPLGIAAKLILEGKVALRGVQIPVAPELYEPVLRELEEQGIRFS